MAEHINRYVFASGFCRGKAVLDVACGTGYGSEILRSCGAEECIGADVSKNAVAYAAKYYSDCPFVVADAAQMGFCRDTFDVICSFETIEHIEKYEQYLLELKNLLRPGGLFIISTPLKEAWSPYGNKSANMFHVKEFSQKEFCSVIGDLFQIVGLYGQGLCSIRRFVLYPYEVLAPKIFGGNRIFLDRILNRLSFARKQTDLSIVSFKNSRFTVPKYIIAVCRKPAE
jgi:ubiquinone/menaquinone biosynthesis C-methylase UbiE